MALWGNNDDITVATSGKVTLDYATGSVTGTATTFTNFAEGDVIRFGDKFTGTYFGDAVITGITSDPSVRAMRELAYLPKGEMDPHEVPDNKPRIGAR